MALAFYGARPTDPDTGKPCICHHLVPDKLDYRPDNLLCWLTRKQHLEADRRQRAMRKLVPDGDLHVFSYERLRYLQDPRVTCAEVFQTELANLRHRGYHRTDPAEQMAWECTHHMEN